MTITLNGDTGITSPNDTTGNQSYTGTLTGGTGVVNLGSGQFYKDASGNVGIGKTPNAWSSDWKALQFGAAGALTCHTAVPAVRINSNLYDDGVSEKYIVTNSASKYEQYEAAHKWYTAPSGTAGTTATLTERMRIDSSGNLLVGTETALKKLTVNGGVYGTSATVGGSPSGTFSADTFFIQNEGPNIIRSYCCGTSAGAYGSWQHYIGTSTVLGNRVFIADNNGFAIHGALSKGSGSFRIDHPLPQLEETHQLVHSFIEGPQADLIYRGSVALVNGKATVNVDTASTMTEGTFEALCRDVQCFTTNESDWMPVRGSVSGNILTIESQDVTAESNISWMVIGERQDKHMMGTFWTDDNGKVIVEPLKKPELPIAPLAASEVPVE